MAGLPGRLFDLVDLLQIRTQANVGWLADRLGVSERTVRRDLARLQDLGVAVSVKPGRGGGVSLAAGSLLPALRFTDEEALALGLGLHLAGRSGITTLRGATETASRRLSGVMGERLQRRLGALSTALTTSPGKETGDSAVRAGLLLDLAEAVADTRQIELSYRSGRSEITTRRLDPYGLVKLEQHWYVAGHCHLRGAIRVFRLDRIRHAEGTVRHFAAPESFDAFAIVAGAIAAAPLPQALTCRVRLECSLAEASGRIPPAAVTLEPSGEYTLLTAQCLPEALERVALHLLGLPFELEVLEPSALRQAFEGVAKRALEMAGPRQRL